MQEIIDEKTGEITFRRFGEVFREDVPFRSRTDLKNYNQPEDYSNVVSQVDTTQYVPLCDIIKRVMRGEMVTTTHGYYDADMDKMSVDEAFATVDETDSPGYDIVDAFSSLEKIREQATPASVEQPKVAVETAGSTEPAQDKVQDKAMQ